MSEEQQVPEVSGGEAQQEVQVEPEANESAAPPQAVDVDDRFKRLERKERELWKQRQEIKEQELRLSRLKDLEGLEELARSNPSEAIRRLRIDPNATIDAMLGMGDEEEKDPSAIISSKIEEIEKKWEEKYNSLKNELEQKSVTQKVNNQIKTAVKERAEKYEIVHELMEEGTVTPQAVYDLISRGYDERRRQAEIYGDDPDSVSPPTIDEVLPVMEEFYEKQYLSALQKLAKLKKFSGRLSIGEMEKLEEAEKAIQANPVVKKSKTLSNDMTSTSPARESEEMSLEERRKKVIEDLQAKLFVKE